MADLKQRLAPLEEIDMPERWSEIERRAPRAGFDPEPPRRQPIAVAFVAIALSVVTVGWVVAAFGPTGDRLADETPWITTAWPSVGIELERPAGWSETDVDEAVGKVQLTGGVLTSEVFPISHADLGADTVTTAWDVGDAPADAVFLSVTRIIGGRAGSDSVTDAPLPDALDDFRDADLAGGEAGRALVATAAPSGFPIEIQVWFGPATTTDDRITVERMLASMEATPPAPRPSISPTPVVEPEPTMDPDAIDLGLGFGLCRAESIEGTFGANDPGRAWFGTAVDEDTLQCRASSRRYVLAIDVDGDRAAEGWINPIGPNMCWVNCEIAGVSDLDADGTREVVLLLEGAAVQVFGVVDVDAAGRPVPVGFAASDEPTGLPGGPLAKLAIDGDEGAAYAVTCRSTSAGPLITQHARGVVVGAESDGSTVRTTAFRLDGGTFVIVDDAIATGVQNPPPLPDDSRLCDMDLREWAAFSEG